eukprot:TRINITY_DN24960_c0_g1_i1.p1 TRINITY_DN24960_c0_g1~~TRINITY_DN24960_c0_g1_i1.p1  ORF type:complete len:1143 (+),score=291.85 TRINITY_DN24960_c0_g1_i1:53-3430(+)
MHKRTAPLLFRRTFAQKARAKPNASVRERASQLLDAEARILADPQQADTLRTRLIDDLKIADDAGENWEQQWRQSQINEDEERTAGAERVRQWEAGELEAGSRTTSRDLDQERYQQGQWESSRYPPHPPNFEEVLRKVRYAHLMPRMEPAAGYSSQFFASPAFKLLPSLLDRLLEVPDVTLERLAGMDKDAQDLLLENHFSLLVPFSSGDDPLLDSEAPLALSSGDVLALDDIVAASVEDSPPQESGRIEPGDAAAEPADKPPPSTDDGAAGESSEMTSGEVGSAGSSAPETAKDKAQFASLIERLLSDNTVEDRGPVPISRQELYDPGNVRLRPQRSEEKVLNVTQTLAAVQTAVFRREEHGHKTWPFLIQSCSWLQDPKYAHYYWSLYCNEVPPSERSVLAWEAYVSALGRTRDITAAYNAVEEMKASGITPTIHVWTSLMRGYRITGDSSSAVKVFDNMKMYAGIEPDHVAFLELIKAHASDTSVDREARIRRALLVFYEMSQVYRLEPLRVHYIAVMRALQQQPANPEFYLELCNYGQQMKMAGIPWSIDVYNCLLSAEAGRGDLDRVRELFLTMRRRKLPPTASTYASVVHCYTRMVPMQVIDSAWPEEEVVARNVGRFQWARKQLLEWRRRHSIPFPWQEHRNRLFEEALEVMKAAEEATKDADGRTHRLLANRRLDLARALRPDLVREEYARAQRVLLETKQDPTDLLGQWIHALCTLSDQGDVDALDEAESAFVDLVRSGRKPLSSVYTALIRSQLRTGREGSVDVAIDYMHAMERAGYVIPDQFAWTVRELVDRVGPKRDAIRRAQQLAERRKELSPDVVTGSELQRPGQSTVQPGMTPDGFVFPGSPTGINPDGTLVGDKPEERAAALAQMGIQPVAVRDTQQLRSQDKVKEWMKHSAKHPHANFAASHPAFDKILGSEAFKKLSTRGREPSNDKRAQNAWHAERMAADPASYDESGQPVDDGTGFGTDGDSRAAFAHAVAQSRPSAADFDLSQQPYTAAYAHTSTDPQAWTEGQERFMAEWRESSAGRLQEEEAQGAQQLRAEVAEQRRIREKRMRMEQKGESFPDEAYAEPEVQEQPEQLPQEESGGGVEEDGPAAAAPRRKRKRRMVRIPRL